MRTPEVCEGRVPAYALSVVVDGTVRLEERVEARGRGEARPVYVLRDVPVQPGTHDLELSFVPEGPIRSTRRPG